MPYGRRETIFTIVGVLCVVFLSILDQTIVGVAKPRIVANLQSFDLIVWVSTAYLLTSTVPIPIYGKLSDLFRHKLIMLFGIVVFSLVPRYAGSAERSQRLRAEFRGNPLWLHRGLFSQGDPFERAQRFLSLQESQYIICVW